MKQRFSSIAEKITGWAGSPAAFAGALILIVLWLVGGLLIQFREPWLLAGSVFVELLTWLLVLLLQRSSNVANESIQLKLNEVLRSLEGQDAGRLDIEESSDGERREARQHDRATKRQEE